MFTSCIEKQNKIIELFKNCSCDEDRYKKIIEFGSHLEPFDPGQKIKDHLVSGCQSVMFLHAKKENNLIFFQAFSDALISAGLAAILIAVYSGETAETILKCPPDFLETAGIPMRLTPSRARSEEHTSELQSHLQLSRMPSSA